MNTVTSRIWPVSVVGMRTRVFKYGFVGILAVLIVALAATGAMAVPSGLVYHWAFDEGPDWHDSPFQSVCTATVATDSVGTADAALMNMTSADWVSGRQFTALDFDGSNDYLQTVTNLVTPLGGTASLSFWIKTTQVGGSVGTDAPGVMGIEATGTTNDVQWGWIDASGRICLSVKGTENVVRSTAAINTGQWRHVVFTRNASTGACQIYVDGVLGTPGTGPTGTTAAAFYSIGRIEDTAASTPRYVLGRLDQIHVFNTAIDQAMVTQLRDNHAPKTWDTQTNGTNTAAFCTESVLFKSYDPEQDTLSVSSYVQPSHGSVTYNGDGTFTYTATTGYTGADSFGVTVEDSKGGFSDAVMNIQVQAPPSDPDAGKRTTTFTNFTRLQAGGVDISLDGWRIPRAIKWDTDADYDMLVSNNGAVWRYMNTGTVSAPVFAAGVKVQAAGVDIALSGATCIALADMTGDGVTDLAAVDTTCKIRVYRNTSAAGQVPVYAAATIVKDSGGADFVLPEQRFDVAYWDADGLPDVIMGTSATEVRAYKNVGTAADPRYSLTQYEVCESGAYNLYPRVFDLNRNGTLDYVRGINWGTVDYYFDPLLYDGMGPRTGTLTFTDSGGAPVSLQPLTDGAIVDFADYNGDGVYDCLMGGHYYDGVYIFYGVPKTVANSIADIETIYNAHPSDLGTALEANSQLLLNQVKAAENNIIMHMFSGLLTERQTMFSQMVTHVQKYSFLQMGAPVSLPLYHHVPSIAGQNLLTMHQMLPDTPTQRTAVANGVGLTGTWRTVYLNTGKHVGDNQSAPQGMIEAVRDAFALYPCTPLFPDTVLTLDSYWNDGRGGWVNCFTSAKNTFGFGIGDNWAELGFLPDLASAIETFYGGAQPEYGDYFTFVMGHEVSHSLDGYVNSRKNTDLRRRWGQSLTYAAGPEVVTSNNDQYGWYDWTATKAKFLADGYWDGVEGNWAAAYAAYFTTGPGKAWQSLSYMRGNIDSFLTSPQESLATQANHTWAGGEARLIGAIDRYRRGGTLGIYELKANIGEAINFLDINSAGLNKIVIIDTTGVTTPYPRAQIDVSRAWLERDDTGHITRVSTGSGQIYDLTYESHGIITAVATNNLYVIANDSFGADSGVAKVCDVLTNDFRLEGGAVSSFTSYTNPSHGTLVNNGNVTLTYTSTGGYKGTDTFTYTAQGKTATVTMSVGGLKSRWRLDETSGTVADDSVGTFDGTYQNGVTLGQAGKMGNAISLDGVDDRVQIPALNLNSNTVAITGWIKKNGEQNPWVGIFVCRTSNTNATLQFGDGTDELRYMWNGAQYWWSSGLVVPDATWTFVALVIEPAQATIYMNTGSGMQSAVNPAANATEEFDGVSYLGLDTSWGYFKGLMDDFRVYDRALSAAEISALYSSYSPADYNPSSYAVIQGSYSSGNVASLVSNDNNYLVIASQTSGTTRYATTDFTVTGIAVASPSNINVQVIAKSSRSNTTQRIKLWNYTTSVWDQKDSVTIGTGEVTRSFNVTTGASNYISGGTLKVETNDSHGSSQSFNASHEVVKVTITP